MERLMEQSRERLNALKNKYGYSNLYLGIKTNTSESTIKRFLAGITIRLKNLRNIENYLLERGELNQ